MDEKNRAAASGVVAGIDVGGTFTDLILVDGRDQDIPLKAGDRVRVGTPGGGGYGDPRERDPALVHHDVAIGYYTAEQAKELFGAT